MGQIATWTAISNLGISVSGITDYTQCPMKSDILSHCSNATISGSYYDDQLVQIDDLSITSSDGYITIDWVDANGTVSIDDVKINNISLSVINSYTYSKDYIIPNNLFGSYQIDIYTTLSSDINSMFVLDSSSASLGGVNVNSGSTNNVFYGGTWSETNSAYVSITA